MIAEEEDGVHIEFMFAITAANSDNLSYCNSMQHSMDTIYSIPMG